MLKIKQFTFNPIQENTYVISDAEGLCAIIDPGCYSDHERKELAEYIDRNRLSPSLLLNTHCHLDHVFGNRFIAETYGLRLHLHPLEKLLLDYAPVSGKNWGLPFDNYEGELVFLTEKDTVVLGKDTLKVLLTPGHSPGSLSFYSEEQKFVIAGDVLFHLGIGRTDLPGGDHNTLLESIRRELFTLPSDVTVYPGHGPSTSIGFEKENNPFLTP